MPFDFDAAVGAPFRMQPGLRRLAPQERQLTPLAADSPAYGEKLHVLRQHADDALLQAEGFNAIPALQRLAAEAARQCPEVLKTDKDGIAALDAGWRVSWHGTLSAARPDPRPDVHGALQALPATRRLAGLLGLVLHEDLAIVDGRSATLPWMAVCLPSHWAPRDKFGRSFAEVHAPVADNDTLLAAGRHLMRLVCQPQRWERFVWTITPQGRYDQHPGRHAGVTWADRPDAVLAQAWWRTEHQTFIPLPELEQAVFTIHVDLQPLAQAIHTPARAAALRAALSTMSEAVLDYRGLRPARPALLDWLAARARA